MTPEIQKANDIIAGMQGQRDQALNALVVAQADLAARDRQIAELTKQLSEKTETIARMQQDAATPVPSNGADVLSAAA